MTLSTDTARRWVERWDLQQEGYLPDREELFEIIADVVEAAADRPDPLIVDLGCGPGSLSARLLKRLPKAEVIGIDTDPVLLELGQANYGIRLVDHDLRDPAWIDALNLDRTVDAFVSTTALHWMFTDELTRLYRQAAEVLRPGGVLVNGDGMAETTPRLSDLQAAVQRRQIERYGVAGREEWTAWWDAVNAAPELEGPAAERRTRAFDHPADGDASFADHVAALAGAGFTEVGTVWQYGARRVLTAIK